VRPGSIPAWGAWIPPPGGGYRYLVPMHNDGGIDWNAIEAVATIIAAVAALIAVIQTGRRSRFAADAARADVSAWIPTDYDHNDIREGKDLIVRVRNDSRATVRIEFVMLRPRYIPSSSLLDSDDAFRIAATKRRDPLVWSPVVEHLEAATQTDITIHRATFSAWVAGASPIMDEDKVIEGAVNPWVRHVVPTIVFSDNNGQAWARLRSGRLKKLSDTEMLYTMPLKKLLPDEA